MLPSDFRVRSLDGIADDWPLTYHELRPYYERTDREFGVSGMGGDPAYPPGGEDPPLPPLPIGAGGLKVARYQVGSRTELAFLAAHQGWIGALPWKREAATGERVD
jgi:choline dehydrogenase-like flavoprotein